MDASIPFTRTPLNALHRGLGARPGGYPGAEVILRQLDEGAARRRAGNRAQGRVPVRAKPYPVEVVRLPFVRQCYYRG